MFSWVSGRILPEFLTPAAVFDVEGPPESEFLTPAGVFDVDGPPKARISSHSQRNSEPWDADQVKRDAMSGAPRRATMGTPPVRLGPSRGNPVYCLPGRGLSPVDHR